MSDQYDGDDWYLDPDADAPRDKLRITSQDELDRAEAMFAVVAREENASEPNSGSNFSCWVKLLRWFGLSRSAIARC